MLSLRFEKPSMATHPTRPELNRIQACIGVSSGYQKDQVDAVGCRAVHVYRGMISASVKGWIDGSYRKSRANAISDI